MDEPMAVTNGAPEGARMRAPESALRRNVAAQVAKLEAGYLADAPWASAALAKLRRGVGREPGAILELAAWTTPGIYVADFREDTVAPQERAAYDAITLYALHQQGQRGSGMHRAGRSFAAAARLLGIALGDSGRAGLVRRFNIVGTATSTASRVHHARGLIAQLRSEGIGFDYGIFADDLRKLDDPRRADGVRMRWGREFHRPGHPRTDAGVSPAEATPSHAETAAAAVSH
ncbi:type I-E CRISPR-associated protein Cse2/CasB [Leucobacter allii]|uniref:type I-E CRISPR-associated protein Cse2/CasB n=1 Tax=Leucobacter allii TaxID=2932247 RepID=UPI001FD3CDB4|nr:type I-E CRISPR-associated protein Cse2/CasB [Leucobacter allii]UOR01726.1 type I-E CRISPR-associated protein Cse2/CasB [Leucobacter allii]